MAQPFKHHGSREEHGCSFGPARSGNIGGGSMKCICFQEYQKVN